MHIFFSGVGGTGIGPLALIAKEAGHQVSGSDKQDSQYISYLKTHGVTNIHIGQTEAAIAEVHREEPIDWYVYSSALPKENPEHPELVFVEAEGIRHSKRDEFLNFILQEKSLKLVAIAGTHGKTTTTAMTIWLFKELGLPISYSVGAKISFGDMGKFDPSSQYFIYECDEFDRNFLAFHPYMSLVTGVAWDHHEIFPSREDYQNAFKDFMNQSQLNVVWQQEANQLELPQAENYLILDGNDQNMAHIKLHGLVNRQNAWQVVCAVHELTKEPVDKLIDLMNEFPGLSRRMEEITPGLYSDYAHTPEKIKGAMGIALEIAQEKGKELVVIYEPLTNRRAHYIQDELQDVFAGANVIYWVPSYLAREDPNQTVLTPTELIKHLNPELQKIAKPMELNDQFKADIRSHLNAGDMVVAMTGGGGNSLDEWLRREFK
jgi:UDP-N-acetylmuramate--alanine ligase